MGFWAGVGPIPLSLELENYDVIMMMFCRIKLLARDLIGARIKYIETQSKL